MQTLYSKERRLGLDRRFEVRLDSTRREGAERREQPRGNLTRLLDSTVLFVTHLQSATLTNVSSGGAGFRSPYNAQHPEVSTGCVAHFDVQTPYGTAARSGRVQWTAHSGEYCYFGVQFLRRYGDDRDGIDELVCQIEARAA